MRKLITFIISIIVAASITQAVFAGALSIRIEQPKTPTNQNTFDVVFVTLDLNNTESVAVSCWKQGPGDGSPVQFDSTQTFTGGGNTGVCPITSSIFTTKGDYTITAKALSSGGDSDEASTVITYNTDGPGDPTGYSKDRTNVCDYKIKFHTADDSGKTVKVEVYRSENTSFTTGSGNRVDTITIGSNTDGQSITTPPSCSKDYYFGIRAFDSAGNGSNVVGDSVVKFTTTTTTTTTTGTTPAVGAIEITSGGAILGKETESSKEGVILGETTPSAESRGSPQTFGSYIKSHGILIGGIILLAIGAIGLYVSKKKTA